MRTHTDWRSASRENYADFCKKHPTIVLSYDQWMNIIYTFNESFRDYILETGDKIKFPYGFGEFSINKKKRKRFKTVNGREVVNLPIDWKRTKEKGKLTYNFNYHTEGYFFGWVWFKKKATFRNSDLWYFKPSRTSSRLINHYIKTNEKYQHMYHEWYV